MFSLQRRCCAIFFLVFWLIASGTVAVAEVPSITEPLQIIVASTAPEVKPLQETAQKLVQSVKDFQLDADAGTVLEQIERDSADWDKLRSDWNIQTTEASGDGDEKYIPSATVLSEISAGLQRRIGIWRLAIQAKNTENFPVSRLNGKTVDDVQRLFDKTGKVVRYFYNSRSEKKNAATWCNYFELEAFVKDLESVRSLATRPVRRVSVGETGDSGIIPELTVVSLCCHANKTFARLNSPQLSDEQRSVLEQPDIIAWKDELQNWTADTVTPETILQGLERYETTGGMTDMKILSQLADRLAVSKTPAYSQLGSAVAGQYSLPNLKVYISKSLINRHIPPMEQEVARFKDVIQDTPVVGKRQTDTDVNMLFFEDPNRLLFAIKADIDLTTQSRSDAFAVQLYNTGSTSVVAYKGIELTQDGLIFYPCDAQIRDFRMRLVNMRTEFDDLPLLSNMFRNVVRDQYNSKSGSAKYETQRKILRQTRSRLDNEIEARFSAFNEKYKHFSKYIDEQFDLHIAKKDARTNNDWLLTSWSVRCTDSLGGGTVPPETPNGAFADVKVHESLVNLFLGQLGLEGNRGAVREFKKTLAEKFQQDALATEMDGDEIEITFAQHNPLTVRFTDNRVELTIALASLRMLKQTHRNFKVIVSYKPLIDTDGNLVLERDGCISMVNVRAQILMRAVFGKIFPVNKTVPLSLPFMATNPDFNYLTTSHCRIQNGWFALALTERNQLQTAVQELSEHE